jgi:NADH:ubiquinone oxidoreductase subunit C
MHNWVENVRITQPIWQMRIHSNRYYLFKTANWMERETWDFTELFEGHPQLKEF